MKVLAIFFIAVVVQQISGLPSDPSSFNYAATASQIIATGLLKQHKDQDNNNVFSPIAVADLLAILAEGSEGKTYEEFTKALGFPVKKEDLRNCFKETFKSFVVKNDSLDLEKAPSFNTWFYIYKNNSAKQEYKDILANFYNVQVKEISRTLYDWDSIDTSLKTSTTLAPPIETTSHHNDRDIPDFETLKRLPAEDEVEFPDKPSKFDTNIDDKEYVDVNVIREQQTTLAPEIVESEILEQKEEDNETIKESEKVVSIKKTLLDKEVKSTKSSGPEKITLPLRDSDAARSISEGARTLFSKDDVVSSLSANSITGREVGSKSKMLLFNGLYYRGNWAYPFQELRSTPKDVFHVNSNKSVLVTLMRTAGKLNYMDCEHLNAEIIEFPYENDNYSLIVFLPKEDIGQLIDKLEPVDIQNVKKNLSPKQLFISLPKFQVEQTCRSEEVLEKLGLKTLFSRKDSQLTLISEDNDLHVEELVQFTNMQVDEGACSENSLSGLNLKSSRNDDETEIKVNKPFVYFVVNKENVVLVSGKIMNPIYEEPQDVSLDVEFTSA